MNKTSTKKNFIFYYIYQLTILLSTLVTIPYISKVLGSEKIGIYSFTFSIANFIYMFAQLGTYSYGVREIALNKDNKTSLSKSFFEITLMKICSTTIFLIIYLVFISCQSNYTIFFYTWILFILSAAFDITWFYAGIEHFEEIFIINIIIRFIGILSTLIFVKSENDLIIYIIIHSLIYLLPFSLMWFSLYKYIDIKELHNLSIIKHYKQALIYFIPTISASLFMVIDKSMLGIIIEDKSESGYYEMASQIIVFSKTLSAIVISHVIQPKATSFYKTNNYSKIKDAITLSLEFATFICVGMIFGIFSIAHDFVPIFFSDKFLSVENILKLMSPLILITAISYIYEYEYMIPANKGKSINKIIIFSAVCNIILNLILIKNFKSIGAVIASIITELIILLSFYFESNAIIKLKRIIKISYKKLLSGFLMLLIIYSLNNILHNYTNSNTLLILMIDIATGAMSYILMLYILKDNIFNFAKDLSDL